MTNNFFTIFYWWLLLFGLGIISLPLTTWLFKGFFDRGYALAKIIGILAISYLAWILGSFKILPFFSETLWLIILLVTGFSFWFSQRQNLKLKKLIQENWRLFVLEEGIFFLALVFWSFVRGFQPNIQGLEKFMDYGFVNSILRSRYFPPADMWLAGETINYYYFGHLTAAVLTKLSGLDSAITYNLMMATLFALSFTAAFCLGGNLIFLAAEKKSPKKPRGLKWTIAGGLLTAVLLTLGGNLHPLWWFLKNGNFKTYWYPDATRFIVPKFGALDNTIHEFPIYSFVVADLHGHLLNLPFVLLFLAIAFITFTQKKLSLYSLAFISLLLGVFYMTNSWDLPIYSLILGGLLFYWHYLRHGFKLKTLIKSVQLGIICLLGAILFSLPFHLHFKGIAKGVALVDFRSPPWMFLVLWGFSLVMTISFAFFIFRKKISKRFSVNHFILVLILVSWFLIILPEFIYVKDIYIHSHQRANTMFKLTYQSFVMFSFISGYTIISLLASLKKKTVKIALFSFIFFLLSFILIYPYFAVRSYYGLKVYQGLYGLFYLNHLYPNDHQAILWLKKNVAGQPVIAEAVGESYTDFARVSANTGLPTVLGWRVHEWLWRGSFDEAGKRTEEVKNIYESSDLTSTQLLLKKYGVNYVFVGTLERNQYPQLKENKFGQLGIEIFREGNTKIYQIN